MTKRIRPSLASYRELERRLSIANGHIELGTRQMSDLQRKYDMQEAIAVAATNFHQKEYARAEVWKIQAVTLYVTMAIIMTVSLLQLIYGS